MGINEILVRSMKNVETFFHPSMMHLLRNWGEPVGIIIETPYELDWARGSRVVFDADDFLFKIPDKYQSEKIGWYGTDFKYYGIWERSKTE